MKPIPTLPAGLSLIKHNQLDILHIQHTSFHAKVALQGAQLLSWQPTPCSQDVIWLSDVEPFETGVAIRGGVPICYPWFGGVKQPAHGTARNRLWTLTKVDVLADRVLLELALEDEALMQMELGSECRLTFTHLAAEPAQVALHSYFKVADIAQIELHNLPNESFNSVEQTMQAVTSPRKFANLVDEIYTANGLPTVIIDPIAKRQINVEHQNASEVVVWNPWHKAMSGMNETGHKTMVCVETARIHRLLNQGETVTAKFSVEAL